MMCPIKLWNDFSLPLELFRKFIRFGKSMLPKGDEWDKLVWSENRFVAEKWVLISAPYEVSNSPHEKQESSSLKYYTRYLWKNYKTDMKDWRSIWSLKHSHYWKNKNCKWHRQFRVLQYSTPSLDDEIVWIVEFENRCDSTEASYETLKSGVHHICLQLCGKNDHTASGRNSSTYVSNYVEKTLSKYGHTASEQNSFSGKCYFSDILTLSPHFRSIFDDQSWDIWDAAYKQRERRWTAQCFWWWHDRQSLINWSVMSGFGMMEQRWLAPQQWLSEKRQDGLNQRIHRQWVWVIVEESCPWMDNMDKSFNLVRERKRNYIQQSDHIWAKNLQRIFFSKTLSKNLTDQHFRATPPPQDEGGGGPSSTCACHFGPSTGPGRRRSVNSGRYLEPGPRPRIKDPTWGHGWWSGGQPI